MKKSGNTILITGGGSGIGQALAQRLHDAGNRIIVAGRRHDALAETVAGRPDMSAVEMDVDDVAGLPAAIGRLLSEHPGLNVLVNNAGIMRMEDVGTKRDLSEAEQTITTNLLGPIRLTDALIDHLVAQPDAAIINVTSGLAFVPMARTATYSATKAALHSYSISLRQALAGRVDVVELPPPGVRTELTPGQSTRDAFMSVGDFADEALARLFEQPTPPEILVEAVKPLRNAEIDGQFDHRLAMVNGPRP